MKARKLRYKYRVDWFDRNTKREIICATFLYLTNDVKYLTNNALEKIIKDLNPEADKIFINNIMFQGYRAK